MRGETLKFPQLIVSAFRKRVIALKPMRFQRFQPAESWKVAESKSRGYSESTNQALLEANPRSNQERTTLSAMDLIVIEAFRTALREIDANQGIRVLDVGGFDGAYSEVMRNQFPEVEFDWTVVELPVVVNHFAAINNRVSYSTDLQQSLQTRPDVVFASAVINYLPNPHEVLESFFNNTKVVILNRQPLWPLDQDQPAIQTAQRKPFLIQYPVWFFSKKQFLSRVASKADVLSDFEVFQDRAYFAGHYGTYRGLVLRTKTEGAVG